MNEVLQRPPSAGAAEPRVLRTEAETALLAAFEAEAPRLPGETGIRARRQAAIAEFARQGLPHRRVEAWKYTDLRALMRRVPPLAKTSDEAALQTLLGSDPFATIDRARIVVADGKYRADLSDVSGLAGVTITPMATALAAGDPRIGAMFEDKLDPLLALNTALAADGVLVSVAPGTEVTRAIEIVNVASGGEPGSSFVRNVIDVRVGASVRLIETFLAAEGVGHQANATTEIRIGDRARVKMAKLDETGSASTLIGSLVAELGAHAEFDHVSLAAGGALSRSQMFVKIGGEKARLGISGATLLGGKRHADVKLLIEHNRPGATSRVLFKNVADGASSGAFQGLIIVAPDAQKTDGKMMTRTLLLSDDASFSQKPELEIYADDVQCGHGATSGRIDEEMLFYLLSRGIPRLEAEQLLLQAFLAAAVEAIDDSDFVSVLDPIIERWLAVRS